MNLNSDIVETLGNKCSFCPKYFPSFTRKRNHESLEHYSQLQEMMESMGVKMKFRTSVAPNDFNNDNDKKSGVLPPAKRKVVSDNLEVQRGSVACPLCPKYFKTQQTMMLHFGKKHPDSRSYSLRRRSSGSNPETETAAVGNGNTNVRNKRLRPPTGRVTPAKTPPMVLKKSPKPKDLRKRPSSAGPTVAKLEPWTHFTYSEPQKSTLGLMKDPEPVGESIACQICTDVFYGLKYLDWHVKNEHPDVSGREITGAVKRAKYDDVPELADHTSVTSSTSLVSAKTESLHSKGSLKELFGSSPSVTVLQEEHQDRSTQETFSCSVCSKSFSSHVKLASHLTLHRRKINGMVSTVSKRKEEQETGGANKKLQVEVKRDNTLATANLVPTRTQTQGIQGKGGVYYCPICDYKVSSLTDAELEKHIKNDHADISGPITCLYCTHQSIGALELLYHLRGHDREKPFPCHFCDSKFRQYYQKLEHEVAHTKAKDGYNCSKCGSCYLTSFSLQKHMAEIHS